MALTPSNQPGHVDVMDGLRAMAIAWVVALHVWQLAWLRMDVWVGPWKLNFNHLAETGFSGVELFFFVSGFCLFYPYARTRTEGREWPSLRHYAFRRAIKILPSYWLAIALILAYSRPAWLWEPGKLAWNLATHLVFVHNWFKDTESAINGVFWSLGVEVQFYLLFPLIAWAFVRRPLVTWAAMVGAAIAWRHGMLAWQGAEVRFMMDQLPGYLDLFACGMGAAFLIAWLRPQVWPAWRQVAATLVAIAAIGAIDRMSLWLYEDRIGNALWPWTWQVGHRHWLALAFLVLAVGSARATVGWQEALSARWIVFLSTISYNLYIWHQFIGRELMNTWKIPAAATPDPHGDPAWTLWFFWNAIAVSILFASVVTYAFERPLLRWRPKALDRVP